MKKNLWQFCVKTNYNKLLLYVYIKLKWKKKEDEEHQQNIHSTNWYAPTFAKWNTFNYDVVFSINCWCCHHCRVDCSALVYQIRMVPEHFSFGCKLVFYSLNLVENEIEKATKKIHTQKRKWRKIFLYNEMFEPKCGDDTFTAVDKWYIVSTE